MKKTIGLTGFIGLALALTLFLIVGTATAQESDTAQTQEGDTAESMESETAPAMESSGLSVETAVVCESVTDLQPVNEGTSFSVNVGRLYCFTKIVGADSPVQVTHVWLFGDMERARVDLNVKGASWRTYSSKVIQAHEIGPWKVDILGPDGTVLQTVSFETTQ